MTTWLGFLTPQVWGGALEAPFKTNSKASFLPSSRARRCSPHAFCCWFQLPYFPGCLCEAPRKTSFLPTAQCGSPAQTCSDVVTVPSLSRIWLFETPWTAAGQASLSITEFTETRVHWVGDAIQPSHPLSPWILPPPCRLQWNIVTFHSLIKTWHLILL